MIEKLLTAKGEAVKSGNNEKNQEINCKIDDFIKAQRNEIDEKKRELGDHVDRIFYLPIQVPCYAYITFEKEAGYDFACELKKQLKKPGKSKKIDCLGEPLKFSPAPEPTNIIWENLHWSKKVKGFRTLVSLGVVAIALLIAFAIFFILKT